MSEDIKERLQQLRGGPSTSESGRRNLMQLGEDALARIEALEAQLAELQRENGVLRDVLMNPDPDSEPDNLRLHREKCDMFERALKAEDQLAAAREALEAVDSEFVITGQAKDLLDAALGKATT